MTAAADPAATIHYQRSSQWRVSLTVTPKHRSPREAADDCGLQTCFPCWVRQYCGSSFSGVRRCRGICFGNGRCGAVRGVGPGSASMGREAGGIGGWVSGVGFVSATVPLLTTISSFPSVRLSFLILRFAQHSFCYIYFLFVLHRTSPPPGVPYGVSLFKERKNIAATWCQVVF